MIYPLCFFPNFSYKMIPLDLSQKSSLDWKEAIHLAKKAKQDNQKILWKLELGLFANLYFPLSHEAQFLTLRLGLDHFLETLYQEFKEETLGAIVFEGNSDFLFGFPWNQEQELNLKKWMQEEEVTPNQLAKTEEGLHFLRLFCRDVCADFLKQLTANVPDALHIFLLLNPSEVKDPLLMGHLISPECFERIHFLFKEPALFYPEPTFFEVSDNKKIAVLWPSIQLKHPKFYEGLKVPLLNFLENGTKFRYIPEPFLTHMWDNLDSIIFNPDSLSTQGKRKLQGFCSAGGYAVSTGNLIGLTNEITFIDFLKNKNKA